MILGLAVVLGLAGLVCLVTGWRLERAELYPRVTDADTVDGCRTPTRVSP